MKFKSEVQLEALNNATTDTDKFLVSDSSTIKYRTGAQLLSDLGVSGIYVPYTGATGNVDLGTHTLLAKDLIINHSSGSGIAASITKNGSGEALTVIKGSGSGNAMSVTGGLTSLVDLRLSSIPNSTIDTDRFIVSDGGGIKYRTGAQVLSDIGAQAALTNPVTGTGTLNFVSKFTGATTLGNSLIFDNGTNVGVGTTSPSYKLQVNGNGYFSSALTVASDSFLNSILITNRADVLTNDSNCAIFRTNGDPTGIRPNEAGNLVLQPRSSILRDILFVTGITPVERMTIKSSGNVGIGTTSPTSKLEIRNAGSDTVSNILTLGQTNLAGTDDSRLNISCDANNNLVNFISTGTNLGGFTFNSGGTERMRITSGGDVGIGTTSPSALLHTNYPTSIFGSSNPYFIASYGGSNVFRAYMDSNWNYVNEVIQNGVNQSGFVISTNGLERMRIASTGNVGIGTTNPQARLDVRAQGALSTDIAFRVRNSADTTDLFQVLGNGGITMSAGAVFYTLGNNLNFRSNLAGGSGYIMDLASFNTLNSTNLEQGIGSFGCTYAPTSGTGTFNGLKITTIINQTGGANGITRGLFINPTITAAASFRAIETTVGNVILGSTSGNVGIGTTSPVSLLHVRRDQTSDTSIVVSNSGTASSTTTLSFVLQENDTPQGWFRRYRDGSALTEIGFSTALVFTGNVVGTKSERMRITSAGNVGIGTTSPSALLDVNGDALINGLTIGQGPVNNKQNTAIGKSALKSIVGGRYNIALGHGSNSDNDASGLTTIGVDLNTNTNLSPLGRDCLAISQHNSNAPSNQVPHIYAPEPISITSGISTDIITFEVDHYAGAIVEYLIRLNNSEDYAMGTVYMAWKSGGSGNYTDTREIEWNDMSGFVFDTNGGSTLSLDNTSGNDAWVRITVRGMMTN